MLSFRFLKRPGPAAVRQIISLYSRQGWWGRGDTPELAAALVRNSHCFLAVFENGRAVGMGRAVSDRVSDAYIQDVTVLKEYRGRGLGTAIVLLLKKKLKSDGVKWVGLIAQDGSWPLYRKLGFRPVKNSVPMMLKGNRV